MMDLKEAEKTGFLTQRRKVCSQKGARGLMTVLFFAFFAVKKQFVTCNM